MKKGWEAKRISEIATHSLGKMLDKAKNRGEPKPYLRNLNVRWGEFDLSDLFEMRFLLEEAEKYTAVKGDVLICEGGYPGRAAIWDRDEPIYFQKALHRVRFHEPERNKWFVYYLQFRDLEGTLRKHFNGAGIQHFTGEALARFELPVPPLAEQQRIVGVLDEAFASLATAQAHAAQNLQNARALFESHLQAVFTNEIFANYTHRLSDFCERITKGSSPKWQGMAYVKKPGVLFVTSENVHENRLIVDEPKYVEERFNNKEKRSILKRGDVLTNLVGASIGRTAVYDLDDVANINQAVGLIRCHADKMYNHYLMYYLNSPSMKAHFHSNEVNNARANISLSFVSEVEVPVTTIEHQKAVVERIRDFHRETQRLESIYQRKLAAIDEFKKSILHQAFSGEL
jgi:type I restriction enzyme S subunit